ncbi:copper-transporting ATPase [[Candida] anglica]|uniref:Copper-transporting ATPase n=1 Tax=[Candida] anglica TaxID=148631 RepID=A0ABP0E821_9ASCO
MGVSSYFTVSGMTCGSCSASITNIVSAIPGVDSVDVSLITEEAKVVHSEAVSESDIISAITGCGFDATPIKSLGKSKQQSNTSQISSTISISGMTCGSCSATVTEALEKLPGVSQASVSLITEEAMVYHDSSVTSATICETIENCGFDAKQIKSGTSSPMNTITNIAIGGMTCASCTSAITDALEGNKDVVSVSVSLLTEEASITHHSSLTSSEIKQIIEDCGFEATIQSSGTIEPSSGNNVDEFLDDDISLQIFGIDDTVDLSNFQYNIEARLNSFPGVIEYNLALRGNSNTTSPIITEANSSAVQEARSEFDDTNSNIIDELFISYYPAQIGVRQIVDELNSILENVMFVPINAIDQASSSQLKLLSREKDITYWRWTLFQSLLFGIPVIFMAHTQHWTFWKNLSLIPGLYLVSLLELILTFHVQFHLGKTFLKKFAIFVRNRGKNATMDVLVCISTTISFTFSILSIILSVWSGQNVKPPKVLFDTSCMLISFIALGKWLENKAKGATSSALSKLLSLTPTSCSIVLDVEKYNDLVQSQTKQEGAINSNTTVFADVVTKEIAIDLIQAGDIALVLPGGKIPADGVISLGQSEIDESFITGEALPTFKQRGDNVIGGSINGAGLLYIEVIHTGKNSQLQQIINLVKQSQVNKAPVQRFADYIASRFVPTVLVLATTTFTVWVILCSVVHPDKLPVAFTMEENGKVFVCLKLAISVVVVACPCALGLAAPTAIMVGTGVGAEHGVLIKGGDVLENASDVNIILFDKTGTLTTGEMNVSSYQYQSKDINEQQWWTLIASLETHSEHPVGRALVKAGKKQLGLNFKEDTFDSSISNFKVMPGLGIQASITLPGHGKVYDVCVGNDRLMFSEYGSKLIGGENAMKNSESTDTVVHVIINSVYSGSVSCTDKVKAGARDVIDYLQYVENYKVGIVTGDNKRVAAKIGKDLGIPECNIFSEISPVDKDKVVVDLRSRFGGKGNVGIAFVGDGINDAPALAQADVGMAISSGSDIAIESADIVLLGGNSAKTTDLTGVPVSLSISSATFSRIKTNFVWAAVYNLIMLPFAMGCFLGFNIMLPPLAAAGAMAMSSVSVVISSLLLKRWKPPVIYSASPKEEDIGTPFSLKTSTLEEFNRTKRNQKLFQRFRETNYSRSHNYEMLPTN